MIERYTRPEMASQWDANTKHRTWIEVELAVLSVQESLGQVPAGVSQAVEAALPSDSFWNDAQTLRMNEIEAEVKHDVIAFLTVLSEAAGDSARFLHNGMTSSDLIDTALSLQIQRAGVLLQQGLETLRETLYQHALTHQHTPMVGRSHGMHGEPITWGWKILGWVDELDRQLCRLEGALAECAVGQMSGPMGTYSNISPEVEAQVCRRLGLRPARTSTQVISRDVHAQLLFVFASIGTSLERFATEIRHLQRTDVREVEEAFTSGQKGSSAMPHKRNPISAENLSGLARLLRSYVNPGLENIVLWHERDISHSSVERVIFPDAFIVLDYMLHRFNRVMRDLVVYPERMKLNMNTMGGIIFSQRVLLALVEAGLSREAAYALVQRNAMAAWDSENGNFQRNVSADPQVQQHLSADVLSACFESEAMLQHVDAVFARFT